MVVRRTLILIVELWMIVGIVDCRVDTTWGWTTEKGCAEFKWEDAVDAMQMSKDIHEADLLVEGQPARNAPKWTVKKVIHSERAKRVNIEVPGTFSWTGQPLKAVIATKTDPAPTTMVIFQGTNSVEQLFTELKEGLESMVTLEIPDSDEKNAKVMKYFWTAYQSLKVNEKIGKIDRNMKYIVTGHSLGGALASLFALDMRMGTNGGGGPTDIFRNQNTKLITFGQPRVGNLGYAQIHDSKIPIDMKLRFVYNADPIPHVPPQLFEKTRKAFTFIGKVSPLFAIFNLIVKAVLPEEDYWHHEQEVLILRNDDDTYNIEFCDFYVDGDCSEKINPILYNPVDHLLPEYVAALKAFIPLYRTIEGVRKTECLK